MPKNIQYFTFFSKAREMHFISHIVWGVVHDISIFRRLQVIGLCDISFVAWYCFYLLFYDEKW